MLSKRTNVLLTQNDYAHLVSLATEEKQTISELVRKAIRHTYNLNSKTNRAEILARLRAKRSKINIQAATIKTLIEDGRRL